MNLNIIYILLIASVGCSENKSTKQFLDQKPEYSLIRDNLYIDTYGNLYLKAENVEEGNLKDFDVWLSNVYLYLDGTAVLGKENENFELKDFVDTATFHLTIIDYNQGAAIYEDENYRITHKFMADGGTINLSKKN